MRRAQQHVAALVAALVAVFVGQLQQQVAVQTGSALMYTVDWNLNVLTPMGMFGVNTISSQAAVRLSLKIWKLGWAGWAMVQETDRKWLVAVADRKWVAVAHVTERRLSFIASRSPSVGLLQYRTYYYVALLLHTKIKCLSEADGTHMR